MKNTSRNKKRKERTLSLTRYGADIHDRTYLTSTTNERKKS